MLTKADNKDYHPPTTPWIQNWIKALRSGEFNQAPGTLYRVNTAGDKCYCCLGVLMDSIETDHLAKTYDPSNNHVDESNLETALLPLSILGDEVSITGKVADHVKASIHILLPINSAKLATLQLNTALVDKMIATEEKPNANLIASLGLNGGYEYEDCDMVVGASKLNDQYNATFEEIAEVIEAFGVVIT